MKELYLKLLAVQVRIINAQRKQILARIKIQKIIDEQEKFIPSLFNIHY